MASIHEGHRGRLKRKLLKHGIDSFEPHEVLELLLFYAIPRGDVNPLAHKLIDTFGSFDRVLEADAADLIKVDGVGEHTAALLKLILGSFKVYTQQSSADRFSVSSPHDVMKYATALYIGETVEKCYLLSFSSKLKLISCDLVSQGSGHGAAVLIKNVAEIAARHRAVSVILVHNHPGGNLMPSMSDTEATRRILYALDAIGIELADHVIVAAGKALSFAETGALLSIREGKR